MDFSKSMIQQKKILSTMPMDRLTSCMCCLYLEYLCVYLLIEKIGACKKKALAKKKENNIESVFKKN